MAPPFRRDFAAVAAARGPAGLEALRVGVGVAAGAIVEGQALQALAALKRLDEGLLAPLP
jgi:hypothetical protein